MKKWASFSLSVKQGEICGGPNWESCPQHAPLQITIQSTLSTVTKNRTELISFDKTIRCPHCHGSGANDEEHVQTCDKCGGYGIVQEAMPLGECLQWEPIAKDSEEQHWAHSAVNSIFGWINSNTVTASEHIVSANRTVDVHGMTSMRGTVSGTRDWFMIENSTESSARRCLQWKTSQSKTRICPICGGHGLVPTKGHECEKCSGNRVVAQPTSVALPIPPGVYHGYSKVSAEFYPKRVE